MPSNGSSRESLIISFHRSSRRPPPKKLHCIPTAEKRTNVPGLQNPTWHRLWCGSIEPSLLRPTSGTPSDCQTSPLLWSIWALCGETTPQVTAKLSTVRWESWATAAMPGIWKEESLSQGIVSCLEEELLLGVARDCEQSRSVTRRQIASRWATAQGKRYESADSLYLKRTSEGQKC